MKYYSLNNPAYVVDFREAVLQGQAPDKGLFFPVEVPQLTDEFRTTYKQKTKEEIAFDVIRPFVGDAIDEDALRNIVEETVAFPFPLVQITERIFTLELFHGPTAAFKDVGARFMSRCLRYFMRQSEDQITVLVATSGDTGGAVADAFYKVPGIEVIILFPAGKVSHLQEMQLTTYGANVKAIAVDGNFDDCQAMVKKAFADPHLKDEINFSSANSINVARWLSQQFYYFYAVQQWPHQQAPVISVPSGNFGNICAGLMAWQSGLAVDSFVAACNENDVFTQYLDTGEFIPQAAKQTVSNAMDVGNPSNFQRVLQLFDQDFGDLKNSMRSWSFNSKQTKEAIHQVYKQTGYIMDPHGAVGYLALEKHLSTYPAKAGFFLETAHPAKFADTVAPIAGDDLTMPPGAQELFAKKQHAIKMPADYETFKAFLHTHHPDT